MSVYLDCNATTPLEPQVIEIMRKYLETDFANEGSRTHEYGNQAKVAVETARERVGLVVGADKSEVIFTSGATESNNLAILGLVKHAEETGNNHIITSSIEHKAVLEPIALLEDRGFDITILGPGASGVVTPEKLQQHLTDKTLLVSLMHANNETGALQPIDAFAEILDNHHAFFHVDAAQSYGKEINPLKNKRIDLISCSAHKVYGPKGIGALIARKRKYKSPPLEPIMVGGGQERGLRPGTLPVHQIAGFGVAAELALSDHKDRKARCISIKQDAIKAFETLDVKYHTHENSLASTLNLSVKGVNSEAAIISLKGIAAISNGSACTSSSYTSSYVLTAMGLEEDSIDGALRFSWCHLTEDIPWEVITEKLKNLS